MLHVQPAVSIRGLKATEVDERAHRLDEIAVNRYDSRTKARAQIQDWLVLLLLLLLL